MSNNSGEYKYIHVGETDCFGSQQECASMRDKGGFPIFELSADQYGVEIIETLEYFYTKRMSKADAIAALNELIHYIETNADD